MSLHSNWELEEPRYRRRLIILAVVAILFFLLLVMRLWFLQVIRYDNYRQLSEKNRIRYLPITASRGGIFDRNGLLLVDNRPSYTIAALRREVTDPPQMLNHLAGLLGEDIEPLQQRWQAGRGYPPYRPVPLAVDVSLDTVTRVQEQGYDLNGVITLAKPVRTYPLRELGAHMFGYIAEVTDEELGELRGADYQPGDLVGKSGLEKLFEGELKGVDGRRLLEVDVRGKELRTLQVREPLPGSRLYLTLDRDLQLATEKAFGEQAGAAVALDVKNGKILAMVSRPAFNPELFARGISGEEWLHLLKNSRHPLQFKAINGQYPPGSTFKIVTALAALKAGLASASTTVDCQGSIDVGNRSFRCWKKKGHGKTNLKKALRESCDVWFYKVAQEVGIDRISAMAFDLGLGEKHNFLLEGEKPGLIPTREWKRQRFNDRWYDGETVISAIGQGFVLTTPLQLAMMISAVANGGKVFAPELLERIEDRDGKLLHQTEPQLIKQTEVEADDLATVRRALVAAVNEPHGTGWAAKLDSVLVAGKTGTAQVVRRKSTEEEELGLGDETPYRFRDHALFVSYAPADAPEVAIAVVVEHGSHGSSSAAPIAKAMFLSYFRQQEDAEEIQQVFPGD